MSTCIGSAATRLRWRGSESSSKETLGSAAVCVGLDFACTHVVRARHDPQLLWLPRREGEQSRVPHSHDLVQVPVDDQDRMG
jgi:hypothetical protein